MPLSSLLQSKPDYVLEVFLSTNPDTNTLTKEAIADLEKLLETLNSKNFYIEIRPGTLTTMLIFIRLDDIDLIKAVESDKINDWIYGVNGDILKSDIDLSKVTIAERLRIINQILITPISFGGCGITPKIDNWNFVRSVVPVANMALVKAKFTETKSKRTAFNEIENEANIQFILENFGTQYAFYHQFVNTFVRWLLPLALIGCVSNFLFLRYSIFYTFINLIWSIGFYLYWKFTQLRLSKKWGVSDNIELLEVPKSDLNLKEPTYKRLIREISFIPTALLFVGWLISAQLFCFFVEIFLNEIYDGWLKPYMGLVPTIMLTMMVPVITLVYDKYVSKSLEWEGHSKNSTFHYSKTIKSFVFNFLTSYMALFITSFLYLPFGFKLNNYLPVFDSKMNSFINITLRRDNYAINGARLNTQYQFFIVTNQIIGLILEFVLPNLIPKILSLSLVKSLIGKKDEIVPVFHDSEEEKEFLLDVRSNLQRPEYDVDDDYRQMVLQFGYLVLFGPVWSIGPLVSLCVDLIQQKMDFVKLLKFVKTPIPGRSSSIFPWDDFMKFLVWIGSLSSITIAIMYNGDIVSSSSRSAVGIRWWKIVGPALVFEHLVYLVIRGGEKVIDYYVDYLDQNETDASNSEIKFRQNYLESVYQKKTVVDGDDDAKSLNDISALLKVSSIIPQQLIKSGSALPKIEEKKKETLQELNAIDVEIAKAEAEKLKLDQLYQEKNSEVKATETSHVKKIDELDDVAAAVDDNSKDLIDNKSNILNELDSVTSKKLSELEQLKQQKEKLESLKQEAAEKVSSVNGGAIPNTTTTDQTKILEKLKQYVPESVTTTAEKITGAATAAATSVATATQSKLGELPDPNSSSETPKTPKTPQSQTNLFDMDEGDRVIMSKANVNGELKSVAATIDNNEHFTPPSDDEQPKVLNEREQVKEKSQNAPAPSTPTTPTTAHSHHSHGSPQKHEHNHEHKVKNPMTPLKTFIKKF